MSEVESMLIHKVVAGDLPVNTLDDDDLGREKFCEALAELIVDAPKSYCRVISLEGQWGEGKTSAINITKDIIGRRHADKKPYFINLNPWQIGGKDQLVIALLKEFSAIIKSEAKTRGIQRAKEVADSIDLYAATLIGVVNPNWLLPAAFGFAILKTSTKLANKHLGNLENRKRLINEEINRLDRPIIVVIDDVDRLLPAECLEIVRFIRAVADFEQTTYILAYEHDRVVESLRIGGIPSPDKYLEKIVQIRLHLPPVSPQAIAKHLHNLLDSSSAFVNRQVFNNSLDARQDSIEGLTIPLIRNLRTLKRIFVRCELVTKDVARNVEFWDLFALNTLAVVSSPLYSMILSNQQLFARQNRESKNETESNKETLRLAEETISHLGLSEKQYVLRLVRALFPIFGKTNDAKNLPRLRQNGRIGSPEILRLALSSSLEETAVSLDLIRDILYSPERRENTLSSLISDSESFSTVTQTLRDELSAWPNPSEVRDDKQLLWLMGTLWKEYYYKPANDNGTLVNATQFFLLFVADIINQSSDPESCIRKTIDSSSGTLLPYYLLEDLVASSSDDSKYITINQRKEFVEDQVAKLFERASWELNTDASLPSEFESSAMFALMRLNKDEFDKFVFNTAESTAGRQFLLGTLGIGIISSVDGRVATWPEDMRQRISVLPKLILEAETIVKSESSAFPAVVFASARALLESKQIVVNTGAARPDR